MADIISLCTDKIAAVHTISALFFLGYIYLSVSHTEILTVALTLSTRKFPCALRLVPEKISQPLYREARKPNPSISAAIMADSFLPACSLMICPRTEKTRRGGKR